MLLAEDGVGIAHLIGVTDDGSSYPLARNAVDTNEFAGPVFSPDRRTLFVNLHPGHDVRDPRTLAPPVMRGSLVRAVTRSAGPPLA